jgi:hypothetical protein
VRALGNPGEVRVGEALLGRAVDALGDPIDGGPRLDLPQVWPLAGQREGALERASVEHPFDCGVRAINALATMGVGQRLGIMAGSGVGKSVLVDTIAGHAVADVTVVALIGERAREVSDFVNRHIDFGYPHARRTRSAWEAYNEGKGVCRDYAHLAIAFCRCMNIPARYCTGYLGDIGTPKPWGTMDFAGWMEVWLGDRWYTFDARNNTPRIGRVLIARGRDASDVALASTFGPNTLRRFRVWTDEVIEAP